MSCDGGAARMEAAPAAVTGTKETLDMSRKVEGVVRLVGDGVAPRLLFVHFLANLVENW